MKQLLICDDSKVDEVAPLCRALGVGIEVQAFYNPRVFEDDATAVEKHCQSISGIRNRSMHGCFGDLCPGSFDAKVRELARQRFEQSYHIATRLEVQHVVFHHGHVPHTSSPQGWLKRSTEFWLSFLEGKITNISFHLENVLDWEPRLLSDVVKSIDLPNVDVNLDIGHVHCNAKTTILKWIEHLNTQIGYVHMHDNHGQEDEHLGLGRGTIPMKEVCLALEEYAPDAIWALEAEGAGIQQSVDWLRDNGLLEK